MGAAAGRGSGARRGARAVAGAEAVPAERLRLGNLGPQPGSKRGRNRIGRGYGAGQGGSCGKGMRGQNSRSGGGTRPGFEGGQQPLYRRLPKLKGIAGGMGAGLPDFNTINLGLLDTHFEEGAEVDAAALKEKGLLNPSGRERNLPLKVLGGGDLTKKLTVKAEAFSAGAKEKLEGAGGSAEVLPGKQKWVRKK